MPTASSGLPDRSGSDKLRKARLSKDDDRLLSDGAEPEDELAVDATDDDLVDDADLDEDDAELDEDDAEDDDREAESGTTLTKKRTKAAGSTDTRSKAGTKAKAGGKSRRPKDQRTSNPFVALIRFVREVVGEMRKVLWPTRRELVVYTIAVIIFVTVLISIVGGLDFGFARLVLLVFG